MQNGLHRQVLIDVCLLHSGGESPIPAADQQALRENLLEGVIRHALTLCIAARRCLQL